jgi:hypothetical protein
MYFFQKESSVIHQMNIEQRYYTIKTHALLSWQTIVGYEKDRRSRKAKERKSPLQMIMAPAIIAGLKGGDGDRYVSTGMV